MSTTINERFSFLLEHLNLKPGPFARSLNVSETSIRNYTDRTSKPSSEVLATLVAVYPQVNLYWLVCGTGEPLLTGEALRIRPQPLKPGASDLDLPVLSEHSYETNWQMLLGILLAAYGRGRGLSNPQLRQVLTFMHKLATAKSPHYQQAMDQVAQMLTQTT